MMNIPALVFVILFGVTSLVHLFFCYKESEKLRKISKCFCLLFLSIAAILFAPDKPLIYVGALCGMVGDYFMINKQKLSFLITAMILFFAGHVLYCIQGVQLLSYQLPYYAYIIAGGFILICLFALYPITGKMAGKAGFGGNVYLSFLIVALSLGIMIAVDRPSNPLPGILFAVGYLLFFISDSMIAITTYVKDVKRRDFYIMITYLLAQFFIIFGLLIPFITK